MLRDHHHHPRWWTESHDLAWRRVRAAVKQEWEESERRVERNQDVDDLEEDGPLDPRFDSAPLRNIDVDQAALLPDDDFEPLTFEQIEPALRYGAGARQQYPEYPLWTYELEARLRRDWGEANDESAWDEVKSLVRLGWESAARSES